MLTIGNASLSLDDIAVCVFTSALNLRERALSVHNTWLKKFPKGYLIGGYYHDSALKMISLGSNIGEDYQSATKKQFLGLVEMYNRFPDAKWYYVTGCDAYIFSDNLRELLSSFDPDVDYYIGGHCIELTINGEKVIFPGGGPGFALSRALLEKIVDRLPSFVAEWETSQDELKPACDAAMGYLLQHEYGVKVTFREGFYHCPPYDYPANTYKDGEGNDINRPAIRKPIAFHSLSIREMYALDRYGWLEKPKLVGKAFDKISLAVSKKYRTKSLVNRFSAIASSLLK